MRLWWRLRLPFRAPCNSLHTVCTLRMRSSMKRKVFEVRRRCLVCDWEGTFVEPAGTDQIGTPCESCHAPTERVEILGRRSALESRNPHAAALGRLGGLKGGRARASALSPQRRREIAIKAARTRWGNKIA
jgi:hypothetical protein